jgi:ribosomal 50S subunit-associated protein YjgA (DUF615 family)
MPKAPRGVYTQKCSATNAEGNPCGAWAMRGYETCYRHSLIDDEWRAKARLGGLKRAEQRRERAELRDSGRNRHYLSEPTLSRVLEVIAELLDQTIDGVEPNYEARAYGLLAVAELFRLRDREAVFRALKELRPAMASDPRSARLLDLERARQALVDAFEAGRIEAADLPPGVFA